MKIVRIEYDRHRLGLSLKQARSSAEQDGWTFSERGGAIEAPKDALDRLGLAAMPNQDGTAVVDESTSVAAPEAAKEIAKASSPASPEPEATKEPAAESAEPESTEKPAAESAEPEATEEPAADGAEEGDNGSGSSEAAESSTENSAPGVTEQSSDAFNKAKE